MKKSTKKWAAAAAVLVLLLTAASVTAALFYHGYIWFNEPGREEYPVRGIDASEHQGGIDWARVGQAGYGFAFIKATEGVDHADSRFTYNWEEAGTAGLARSAYHFFTFRSPGVEQARNFLAVAPPDAGGLTMPPAVDIELGGNSADVPEREEFQSEFDGFLREVEAAWGRKPVLYVNDESYERFIMGAYEDYPIWNADVFWSPGLVDGRSWLFWQYSPRGRVEGIEGFVDLNVFNGSPEEFASFAAGD